MINLDFSVGDDEKTREITEYHFYISDNRNHDNLFIQYCFKQHWSWLQGQNFELPTKDIV
jgi:hypothetical protein